MNNDNKVNNYEDEPIAFNSLMLITCFFIPLVGMLLYVLHIKTSPITAQKCMITVWVSILIQIALGLYAYWSFFM